ncbi:MAG: hypothetical protein DMD91_16760, partial [Candidatus Rokuibacteriota bacterium]
MRHGSAQEQRDPLPPVHVLGHTVSLEEIRELVGDALGTVTPEGLIGQGDRQLLAVGVGHHAGELPGLGALVRGLLSASFAQQRFGQLDGAVSQALFDRSAVCRAHHPVACFQCTRAGFPPGNLSMRRVSSILSLPCAFGRTSRLLVVRGAGSRNDQPEDGMIDPAITTLRPLGITERGNSMPSRSRSRSFVALVMVLATLTGASLFTLAGPPAAEAQRKKIVNIAAKEPDTLDPHSSTLGQSQAIARFMFRGLTRFAIKDGKVTTAEVEPDLAESWTLSPEGTIWTFKLRKGVQFHKGFGELTAEDVKFSFERQIKKAPGTRYGVNLDVIKSIEVVNPYTVQIALAAFDPIFLLRMVGYQQGYIISKKAVEKQGDQFKWNPVGTGPFYFERHSPREKIVLKAFDKFYAGRPPIDEVHWFDVPEDATKLIGLEKGTFDLLYPEAVTADFADQVKKMGAVIDRRGPGQQERFYINTTKPPFDDIRVRKAFMHAIDRKAIKETMYPGDLAKVASSCVPPGYFGHVPMQFPEHNVELAKKLLAEAGYPNGITIKNYFISKS